MKVGIDTFGCDHAQSGLGAYLFYFISNLNQTDNLEFELFGAEIDRYTYGVDKGFPFTAVNLGENLRKERLFHKYAIGAFIKKNQYDAVLYPAAEKVIPVSFKNHIGIAVVNSVISLCLKNENYFYRHQLKKGLSRVQIIIAPTEYIKKDLVDCGIKGSKIKVVNHGIDHKLFFPLLDIEDDFIDVKPFSIKRPYFIYGSRLSGPEKKHIELIEAFNLFKKKTGLPHRLVLAGSDGDFSKKVHEQAISSEFSSDIFCTGYFPHESFARLYAGAEACVFPSVIEGVGLPILEAMACGVPVLCSDAGSLPEIGGSAAVYFNSDNIEEIAGCMQKIAEDKDFREKKIAEGLTWSSKFAWDKTVEKTIKYLVQ